MVVVVIAFVLALLHPAALGLLPAMYADAPWDETPFDTTLISTRAPREARLQCQEMAPLFRTVTCDIITYDNCGNLYGRPGNVSDWMPSAVHVISGTESTLVSAVTYLQPAVARFHFTPALVGVYEVRVGRSASTRLPALFTALPLTQLVVVHNTISRCTQATVVNTQHILSQLVWSQSRASNDRRRVVGLEGLSAPTSVVTDFDWIYPKPDDEVQTAVRRAPLQPRVLTKLGAPLPEDDANYKYCDVIQQA